VTDDQNVAQFFQINKLQVDQYGHPAIVNAIGSMDVDFIIDEGPDTINMQADAAATLQALGPQFAQQFPDLAIELSPLETRVKTHDAQEDQAKQSQPPPPDPKVAALQAKQQMDGERAQHKTAEDNSLEWRMAHCSTADKIEVARINAKVATGSRRAGIAGLEGVLGEPRCCMTPSRACKTARRAYANQRRSGARTGFGRAAGLRRPASAAAAERAAA
jgi:hypothetical protein